MGIAFFIHPFIHSSSHSSVRGTAVVSVNVVVVAAAAAAASPARRRRLLENFLDPNDIDASTDAGAAAADNSNTRDLANVPDSGNLPKFKRCRRDSRRRRRRRRRSSSVVRDMMKTSRRSSVTPVATFASNGSQRC